MAKKTTSGRIRVNIMKFTEPTVEQCSANTVLMEDDSSKYVAIWYPQMGGYVGKAVASINKRAPGGCFDVWVWHDGEFPFSEADGDPAHLHHCDADQFIRFGENIKRISDGAGDMSRFIDVVFDGPPDYEAGRFVEVEDDAGKSISVGEWLQRPDGC